MSRTNWYRHLLFNMSLDTETQLQEATLPQGLRSGQLRRCTA
jgi:hypothetical protein